MKSTIKKSNPILKTLAVVAMALTLFAANPINAFANNISEKANTVNHGPESAANIQYIGADEKKFQFRVEFENPTAEKFTLVVKVDGNKIYSKEYSDVHFAKNFDLLKEGMEELGTKPTFEIIIGSKVISHSFSIEKKVTESTIVTKL